VRGLRTGLAAIAVLTLAAPASAAIKLTRTDVSLVPGSMPEALRVGNLDRKGGLDIVVALRNTHQVAVLLSKGKGTFAPVTIHAACQYPVDVEIGDVLGAQGSLIPDGKNDVVVGCLQAPAVVVLPGDGAGGLGAPVPTGIGRNDIFGIISGERIDIVALAKLRSGATDPPVMVVRGHPIQGSGSALRSLCAVFDFRPGGGENCSQAAPFLGPIVPANINGGPFDELLGWGRHDPLAPGGEIRDLMISGWQPDLSPLAPWNVGSFRDSGGTSIHAMAAADLEPDGDLDVVIGRAINVLTSPVASVGVWKWLPGGLQVGAPTDVQSLPILTSLAVADLDVDGKPDLATSSILRQVAVQRGNGNGTFGPIEQLPLAYPGNVASSFTMTLDSGDVTGDGAADLVVLDATAAAVSVFRAIDRRAPLATDIKIVAPSRLVRTWRLRFQLAEAATVRAQLEKRGRKGAYGPVRTLQTTAAKGLVRLSLGRLSAGRYRVRLTLTDAAGNVRRQSKSFTVPS
jgi:FG-GAP-like repeat